MIMNYVIATALLVSVIAWVLSGIAVIDRANVAITPQTPLLSQTSQMLARR